MATIEPFDRAMTLAAQAFTSIFPLLITLVAFVDQGNGSIGDDIAELLSLPDSVREALDQILPADSQQAVAFGIISVLIVLISATSLARALGRMYAKAWHEPPSGWNGGWRWIVVIVGICCATIAAQLLTHAAGAFAEKVAALSLIFLLNTILWAAVPRLLLVGRISIVRLLPAAILMGVGSVGLTVASRIYMPHALKIASEHFGALGIAFTLIGWLFIVSFVLIIATVLGAAIVQDEGVQGGMRRLWSKQLACPRSGRRAGRPGSPRHPGS
jgi:membrane protein